MCDKLYVFTLRTKFILDHRVTGLHLEVHRQFRTRLVVSFIQFRLQSVTILAIVLVKNANCINKFHWLNSGSHCYFPELQYSRYQLLCKLMGAMQQYLLLIISSTTGLSLGLEMMQIVYVWRMQLLSEYMSLKSDSVYWQIVTNPIFFVYFLLANSKNHCHLASKQPDFFYA